MTILAPITTRGEFRQITIAPMVIMPGDVRQIVGNQLLIIRDNTVIATYDLSQSSEPVSLEVFSPELISKLIYFKEKRMSGQIATLTKVTKNITTGALRFDFANGNQIEAADYDQAMAATDYIDSTVQLAQDILIRKTLINSPDQTNLETCIGAQCAIDMAANVPIVLTID
jgi:hypothetical protein